MSEQRVVIDGCCRTCGAPIRWEQTTAGKRIPLDPHPVETGNVALVDGAAVVIPTKQPARSAVLERVGYGLRFVPHFATCPKARP